MTRPITSEEINLPYLPYTSREISVGNILLGGKQEVRIQSMTNTDTLDTKKTVEQTIRMIEAGAELVRITAQNIQAAENLENIKNGLILRGYSNPVIADIHYNPKAAEIAAKLIDKVRINPGNYVDRNIRNITYSDREYREELLGIAERLYPLLEICKQNGTAIRIGTNHGSLSQRIVNRYGDTPLGMAESAMEFVRICHAQNFHKLVLSMKASSIRAMIYATRLLVAKMKQEGFDYPIHLGVTEAGDGEDGRLKSAAGIGTLLMEGIGDTIRVSLTEDPEKELPVARSIVNICKESRNSVHKQEEALHPYTFYKNEKYHFPPLVLSNKKNQYADFIFKDQVLTINPDKTDAPVSSENFEIQANPNQINKGEWRIIPIGNQSVSELRTTLKNLHCINEENPLGFIFEAENVSIEEYKLKAAIYTGALQSDGIGQAFLLKYKNLTSEECSKLTLDILQACGTRIHKTEFISCPSCGRTQYKIQEVLQEIKARLSHLKGLKIGVMGCVVNGPGEMADANYGYVGSSFGKVNLYKGKMLIQKNIDESKAIDRLIEIIRENGDWNE